MQKLLPVWLFLLCLLLGSLFVMAFGWVVKQTLGGDARFGHIGTAVVAIASFPDMVRTAFREIDTDPDANYRVPRTSADLSAFRPIRARPGIDIQGLMVRADDAALARTPGWRILVGGFVINGEFHQAALALSPELEVVKTWILTEEDIQGQKPQSLFGNFVHGFALLKDGSVIVSFDVGVSLQRFDQCGKRMWAIGGPYDHSVSLDESGEFVWTLRKGEILDEVVKVSTADGQIARSISMADIIAANPAIDILEIRQQEDNWGNGNPRNRSEKWTFDPFHLNDVEPLPAALADRFPDFEAGDLLMSARSLNLVFVVDPDTLEVKWWRSGGWRRQHDPDWEPTGEISIYDNRMSRDYSRILSIAPAATLPKVVFDGHVNDFYSRIRGKHQFTSAGNLLITSPQQGRAFEVDPNGKVVFEMFNTRPGSEEYNYPLSETLWFPAEAFDFSKDPSCAN
jgi:Arylsulfotransferase (ASST)